MGEVPLHVGFGAERGAQTEAEAGGSGWVADPEKNSLRFCQMPRWYGFW